MTTRLTASNTVAVAAARERVVLDLAVDVHRATSVLNCSPPEISTTEPYSPIARAKASAAPEAIAGRIAGSTIRRKS